MSNPVVQDQLFRECSFKGNLRNIRVSFWKPDDLTVKLLSYSSREESVLNSELNRLFITSDTDKECSDFFLLYKTRELQLGALSAGTGWVKKRLVHFWVGMRCSFRSLLIASNTFCICMQSCSDFFSSPKLFSLAHLQKNPGTVFQRMDEHTSIILSLCIHIWNSSNLIFLQ